MTPIAGPEPQPCPTDNESRRSVLIIDDDKEQLHFLSHCLKRLGYQVWTAGRGDSGLECARSRGPDLILLDLRLPDTDGLQLCATLSDDPQTCQIPIIIVSGVEGPNIVRHSRAAGGHFYIRKPYDPNVLLTLIRDALQSDAP